MNSSLALERQGISPNFRAEPAWKNRLSWPGFAAGMEFKTLTSSTQDEEEFERRCARIRHAMEALIDQEMEREKYVDTADLRLCVLQWFWRLPDDFSQWQIPQAPLSLQPAWRGVVRRMGMEKWLDLIVDSRRMLNQHMAMSAHESDPDRSRHWPAWELTKGHSRKPRKDWGRRWESIGGKLYEGRIIAAKDSPLWAALGDSGQFEDALGTSVPPFALGSTRGWLSVSRSECIRLGVPFLDIDCAPMKAAPNPSPSAGVSTVSPDRAPAVTLKLRISDLNLGMPLEEALERLRKKAAERRGSSSQPPEITALPED